MVLAAVFIAPHGAIVLDANSSHSDGRFELNIAMKKIANSIKEVNPDVILATSPHGISLNYDYGIYFNESARGTAEWDGLYTEYKVDVKIDLQFADELVKYLKDNHCNVSKITAYSPKESIPLRWGEAVPLWFLKDLSCISYIFLSQPQRRIFFEEDFISDTRIFGKHIGKFIRSHEKKIVVLISADLAHTHLKDGPYGWYKEAELFDEMIESWIQEYENYELWQKINSSQSKALCCGLTGFILLQGILSDIKAKSSILVRKVPTYYGMMVASFFPE